MSASIVLRKLSNTPSSSFPKELLVATTLEVNEERFDGFGIRRLYENPKYPYRRKQAQAAS